VPVLSGNRSIGTLYEDLVLRRSLEDETVLDRSVAQMLSPALSEISADTSAADVLHRFKDEGTLLVRDAATGAPMGVLTRHDLVTHLSEAGGSDAV
jgi:predicted transcriptional regulator